MIYVTPKSLVAKTERETTSNSQDKTMIISDISHIEVATEEKSVVGGIATATADANAFASGDNFAGSSTNTSASASQFFTTFPFFSSRFSANSSSSSSAGAA
ncbi:hypothetical protein V5G28_025510 [Scytonema sp. PRP1]